MCISSLYPHHACQSSSSGGQLRAHARSTSGGSSKLGLNLQFAQKEPAPPRVAERANKSAHFHREVRPILHLADHLK